MALFLLGQKVRITHHQSAPMNMRDRVGTITVSPPPMRSITEGGLGDPVEPQCMMRFDDTGHEEVVLASWLESVNVPR